MRKVRLFIAMSLDGYIADVGGNIEWLDGEDSKENDMVSYEEFIQDIDTVIMGSKTYHQLVNELSPNEWIYPQLTSYVITHRPKKSTGQIIFTEDNPCDLVKILQLEEGKDIWICGGSQIVNQLIQEDLIDQYYINVIPTILGNGISLFEKMNKEIKLKLIQTRSYNGITDLVYERR